MPVLLSDEGSTCAMLRHFLPSSPMLCDRSFESDLEFSRQNTIPQRTPDEMDEDEDEMPARDQVDPSFLGTSQPLTDAGPDCALQSLQGSGQLPSPTGEVCFACSCPITDRFLLRTAGRSWHERCLSCSVCGEQLTTSCFAKEGKLLCRQDYVRLYSVRCQGCGHSLTPGELIMRSAGGRPFHPNCFCCVMCGHQLSKGDQYYIKSGHLFCQMDFEKEFLLYPMSHPDIWSYSSCKSDGDSSCDEGDADGGKGPKRPRTILTTNQRRKFKSAFELNPKPCRKVRETLAAETGLTVRVVQVWFQNQRAKVKKLARKQQQSSDGKGQEEGEKKKVSGKSSTSKRKSDASHPAQQQQQQQQDENKNQILKEESAPDDKTKMDSKAGFMSAFNAQSGPFSLTSQGQPPCNQLSDLDPMDELLSGGHSLNSTLSTSGPAPIDKLYCMQTNYFTAPS